MKRPLRVISALALLALALAPGVRAAPAPVPNPGFETDNSGVPAQWNSAGGGTYARDTSIMRSGLASVRLDSGFGGMAVRSDCFTGISASTTYYLLFWYHSTDADLNTITGLVQWFAGSSCGGGPVAPDLTTTITAQVDGSGTAFHAFQATGTSPSGVGSAYVQINESCDGGTDCTTYYDDVVLDTSQPTAVTASSLAARRSPGAVDVTWRAGTPDIAGFDVFRSTGANGRYVKLNRSLIAARGTSYRYRDATARAGLRYVYKLQAVRLDGSRAWAGTVGVSALRS